MKNTTVQIEEKENASFGAFEGDTSGINPEQLLEKIKQHQEEEQVIKEEEQEKQPKKEENEEKEEEKATTDIYRVVVDFIDEKFKEEKDKGQLFLEYVKNLEEVNLNLKKEKEELEISAFIKEKGITKEILEALNGETLKEKEDSLKRIKKINNFTLNNRKNNTKNEVKLTKRF